MFKIFNKYSFYIRNISSQASYNSIINEVELDVVTNADALMDLQQILQEHDKYKSYSQYPAHIQEMIDSWQVMNKLTEE